MAEENKNLEVERKPDKSRLFRIGLILLAISIGLSWLLFSRPCTECYIIFFVYLWTALPLGIIGLTLILAHYFIKLREKKGPLILIGKIIIVFLTLIILWRGLEWMTQGGITLPIYSKIGAITKSEFICQILPAYFEPTRKKTRCLLEVARNKKDPQICERLTLSLDRENCYSDVATITKNEVICEKSNARCYSRVAQVKKDESICEKLTESKDKDNCYSAVAIVKDPNLCQKIINYFVSGPCKYKAERARLGELSKCEKLGYYRDGCLFEAALARDDLNICKKIKDAFNRSMCYEVLK